MLLDLPRAVVILVLATNAVSTTPAPDSRSLTTAATTATTTSAVSTRQILTPSTIDGAPKGTNCSVTTAQWHQCILSCNENAHTLVYFKCVGGRSVGDCLCVRGGETVDMLEVQKLAASVHVAAPLSHRSVPELEALFTTALAAALGIRREDILAVHVVDAAAMPAGGQYQEREYQLTYEVVVPDGQMAGVLAKATSLSLGGSTSSNNFASALETPWSPSSAISIRDLTSPVIFQGLVASRTSGGLSRSSQYGLAPEKQDNFNEGEHSLPISLGTWLLLVGAAIVFMTLGCAGAGLWHGTHKAEKAPPKITTGDEFALEACIGSTGSYPAADMELPYVKCMKSHAPGLELVSDMKLSMLPDIMPEMPPIPEDPGVDGMHQPPDAISVNLPGRGCGFPRHLPELPLGIPSLDSAGCLRGPQEINQMCLLQPIHWSSCPSPQDAALAFAAWSQWSPRGSATAQPASPVMDKEPACEALGLASQTSLASQPEAEPSPLYPDLPALTCSSFDQALTPMETGTQAAAAIVGRKIAHI